MIHLRDIGVLMGGTLAVESAHHAFAVTDAIRTGAGGSADR